MKRKTNFERYLEDQLKDKTFADRFRKAGEEWGKILKVPLRPLAAGQPSRQHVVKYHPSLLCCFGSGRGDNKEVDIC